MRTRTLTVAVLGASVAVARAEPEVVVDGCRFDASEVARALAAERATLGGGGDDARVVRVACGADGRATIAVDARAARAVELADVPDPLAPRVLALAIAAVLAEPPPAPPTPPTPPPVDPEPAPPAPSPPVAAPSITRPARPPLAPWRRGVAARALGRVHGGETTVWGAGVAATYGPLGLGVVAASTRVSHRLGTVTPWLVAVDARLTVACARVCAAVRGELGRVTVASTASDPMIVATDAASVYAHGAGELSIAHAAGELELAATVAFGAAAGPVARADLTPVARLAGWTLTAALEVRR